MHQRARTKQKLWCRIHKNCTASKKYRAKTRVDFKIRGLSSRISRPENAPSGDTRNDLDIQGPFSRRKIVKFTGCASMKRRVKCIHCRNRHGDEYNFAPVENLRKDLPPEKRVTRQMKLANPRPPPRNGIHCRTKHNTACTGHYPESIFTWKKCEIPLRRQTQSMFPLSNQESE